MQPGKTKRSAAETLVQRAVPGELDQGQVLRLCKECPELVTLALLAAGKRIAELLGEPQGQHASPSTPSGMVPIYAKPNTPKRRKKSGAKNGHPGRRRTKPEKIDQHRTHRLKCCPHCDGPL